MTRFAFVTALTFSRAPLVLLGCACSVLGLVAPSGALLSASVALLALSAVTDLFDGALARTWHVTSRLGALADPLMDKVFYLAVLPTATFLALAAGDRPHAWSLLALDVLCLLRDQFVTFYRSVASGRGADVRATFSGKLRTFLGFPILVGVHLFLGLRNLAAVRGVSPPAAGWTILVLALEGLFAVLTLWSFVDYTRRYFPHLRDAAKR